MKSFAPRCPFRNAVAFASATLAVLPAAGPALATKNQVARETCVIEAQGRFGDSWRRVDRRIQRGTNVVEYWIADASGDAATRVYCRYNARTGAIETIAMLAEGDFRPRG